MTPVSPLDLAPPGASNPVANSSLVVETLGAAPPLSPDRSEDRRFLLDGTLCFRGGVVAGGALIGGTRILGVIIGGEVPEVAALLANTN